MFSFVFYCWAGMMVTESSSGVLIEYVSRDVPCSCFLLPTFTLRLDSFSSFSSELDTSYLSRRMEGDRMCCVVKASVCPCSIWGVCGKGCIWGICAFCQCATTGL